MPARITPLELVRAPGFPPEAYHAVSGEFSVHCILVEASAARFTPEAILPGVVIGRAFARPGFVRHRVAGPVVDAGREASAR